MTGRDGWRLARQLFSIALLIFPTGCGRVGVSLLPASNASATPNDASTALDGGRDAAAVDGSFGNNQPVDAGIAADGGSDGGAKSDAGPAPAPCAGTRLLGLCWYLGAASTSCNQNCAKHGGFDSRSISDVGTTSQGGSLATCTQILVALGEAAPVMAATRNDDSGLGCHVWPDGTRYWLDDPSPLFAPGIASPSNIAVRIVCGCLR